MSHNFTELINATTNARQRLKLLAVSHFLEGKSRTDIAAFLKVSRRSVNIWIKAYLHSGLTGLEVKPRSGMILGHPKFQLLIYAFKIIVM